MTGKPKPKVKWLRDNEEIFASEEYQIENFEDGTSVLVINNIYPDDVGTISFEAHNPLGVAVTTALLTVNEGINILHDKLWYNLKKSLIFLFSNNNNNNNEYYNQILFAAFTGNNFLIKTYFPKYSLYINPKNLKKTKIKKTLYFIIYSIYTI